MKKLVLFLMVVVAATVACNAICKSDDNGKVITVEVSSDLLPKPMNVNVALPAGYDSDTAKRYPVVYLLNGHGGNNRTWGSLLPLDSIASVYDIVIVCPDGMNSWYFDSPVRENMQMESFITKRLVSYVDTCFRTLAKAESRAITGLSMGGHGALWLAIRHKDLFHNAGSTSGGVDFTPWPDSWNIKDALGEKKDNSDRWSNSTVASLVSGLEPGQLNIIFDCGTEDFFYDVNCALDSVLNARHIPHVYITSPGAHNGQYWSRSILPQLHYFNTVLKRD
ncbi:MAG: esterase family protein [Paramuribaculum sp.]|nr:esterase family protein [Paramuribaculum sp.]